MRWTLTGGHTLWTSPGWECPQCLALAGSEPPCLQFLFLAHVYEWGFAQGACCLCGQALKTARAAGPSKISCGGGGGYARECLSMLRMPQVSRRGKLCQQPDAMEEKVFRPVRARHACWRPFHSLAMACWCGIQPYLGRCVVSLCSAVDMGCL